MMRIIKTLISCDKEIAAIGRLGTVRWKRVNERYRYDVYCWNMFIGTRYSENAAKKLSDEYNCWK